MQELVSKETERRELSHINDDVKQLAELYCELFIKYVFNRLFRFSKIEGAVTNRTAESD